MSPWQPGKLISHGNRSCQLLIGEMRSVKEWERELGGGRGARRGEVRGFNWHG